LRVEKDLPRQISSLPCRKRKNKESSPEEEKEHNKSHFIKRIVIRIPSVD
jgi:hypothetical protein